MLSSHCVDEETETQGGCDKLGDLPLGLRGSGRAGIRTQGSNNPGCPSPSHLGIAFCFYYLVHQYVHFVIPRGPV